MEMISAYKTIFADVRRTRFPSLEEFLFISRSKDKCTWCNKNDRST